MHMEKSHSYVQLQYSLQHETDYTALYNIINTLLL